MFTFLGDSDSIDRAKRNEIEEEMAQQMADQVLFIPI